MQRERLDGGYSTNGSEPADVVQTRSEKPSNREEFDKCSGHALRCSSRDSRDAQLDSLRGNGDEVPI
jgi:hypothetical protein